MKVAACVQSLRMRALRFAHAPWLGTCCQRLAQSAGARESVMGFLGERACEHTRHLRELFQRSQWCIADLK
jgi:hypothetical protein